MDNILSNFLKNKTCKFNVRKVADTINGAGESEWA
jgi:hypothetical protein